MCPRAAEPGFTLLAITSLLSAFTKSERKVADTVLGDPQSAVYSSITDLAERAGVGETSVIRFCRKLGFQGYQEFKLAVAQNLTTRSEQIHGTIEEDDAPSAIVHKLAAQNAQTIQDTTALIPEHTLQEAVTLLLEADTVYFFGVASSGITALDAKYRFFRLGLDARAETDAHLMAMTASLAGSRDAVVGISTSGSTKDLVDAFRLAKQNGARTLCITSHARSPITQYADVVLLTASREAPMQGGSFAGKLAQIQVLDLLSTLLALHRKDQAYTALEKTAKSVVDKLY